MNAAEMLVVGTCGAVGWLVVWFLLGRRNAAPQIREGAPWHDVLGVGADATAQEIKAAYEKRRGELDRRSLRIMTEDEATADAERRRQLEMARDQGLAETN